MPNRQYHKQNQEDMARAGLFRSKKKGTLTTTVKGEYLKKLIGIIKKCNPNDGLFVVLSPNEFADTKAQQPMYLTFTPSRPMEGSSSRKGKPQNYTRRDDDGDAGDDWDEEAGSGESGKDDNDFGW
jgi:hypothetical protein